MIGDVFVNRFGSMPAKGGDLVLFIHGAGMDSSVWALQGRYLAARGLQVAAPDLPGHGRSDGEAMSSIDRYAEWLCGLVDGFRSERIVLLGHSMGALIALRSAVRLADRCAGLVLLGAAGEMPVHPDLIDAARNDLPSASALIGDWAFASGMEAVSQPVPGTSAVWHARRLLEVSRPGVLANDLRACADFSPEPEWFERITYPSLVIAGALDRMAPARKCAELAKRLGGECEIFEKSGHMMMVEEPARLRRILFTRLSGWLAREG
ncbi:MAG: alpha/beta hydrolase [Geminicoccaceae bacterium]